MNLSRAEAVASLEFGQCSLAASDLYSRAHALIEDKEVRSQAVLQVLDPSGAVTTHSETITVSPPMETASGREYDLRLARNKAHLGRRTYPLKLYAVTRDDVALPVLTFERRDSECDYVQIGDEMRDDAFIVVPPDQRSRKDILVAAKNILESDPRALMYKDLIAKVQPLKTDKEEVGLLRAFVESKSEEIYVGGGRYLRSFNKRDKIAAGLCMYLGGNMDTMSSPTFWSGVGAARRKRQFKKILDEPKLASIAELNFPGSVNPFIRATVISVALKRAGLGQSPDIVSNQVEDLASIVGVEDMFTERLGEFRPEVDSLISQLGCIASQNGSATTIVEPMTVDTIQTNMEISINAVRRGERDTVDISLRPVSQPHRPQERAYELSIDRTSKDVNIDASELSEVVYLLGKTISKNNN